MIAAIRLLGNTHGLKSSPLRRLERVANRKLRADYIVTPEFARALTEISSAIRRQVGVLIDRRGHIQSVIIGDAKSLFLPDLSEYRRGQDRLCGLRLVHTHLNGEPLSKDDLTDLALLRLDLVAAIHTGADGIPGTIYVAHLLPTNGEGRAWEELPPVPVQALKPDFGETIQALEEEFARRHLPRAPGDRRTRAILVHVSELPRAVAEASLDELDELARSAGVDVLHRIIQRRRVDPQFVMGEGRLKQTVIESMQRNAEALVFDLNLTPSQVASLGNLTDLKILDRTLVILDIFVQHAVSREGILQVELAQLRYMLPRLGAKQRASAFSRLTGGIGGRGPGETKLEIDRRRVQDRIALLEREVAKLGQRRRLRRHMRTLAELPVVSILGYTNVGKSTLVNQLTHSHVPVQDALFATLNPVSRRLRFPKEREVIVTDTVGFIKNLPPDLLAAFRATLEELQEADLFVHVLDASSPHVGEQYETVRRMLAELDLDGKPCILALNKIDQVDSDTVTGLAARYNAVPLSALDRSTLSPLIDAMAALLWPDETGIMPSQDY